MSVVAAALVPGMPQLLAAAPAPSWRDLRVGVETIGRRFVDAGVETLVLMSTQWFTVVGHQFQLDPNPRGRHTDENWYGYDYGHLAYDLRIDTDLTERWVDRAERQGLQARRTRYDGFPIDSGTIVASSLLDPGRRFRLAMVSCNLYADVESISTLGRLGVQAAADAGRRVGVVVVSGLSSGLIQRWIEPNQDEIASPLHDRWNRRVLDALATADVDGMLGMREGFAQEAQADSQFRAFAFLLGAGVLDGPGEVLAYGPLWGTGAAAVHWRPANGSSSADQHG